MKTATSISTPPDGGWGWMIVLAKGLSSFIKIPIMQGFGLIFKDKFKEWGISATDTTVILNVNYAFGMTLGLITGPLLNYFGCRKVAIGGSIFVFIGVLATAWSYRLSHFIIFHGVISSFGVAVLMASFSLALNVYFEKHRSKAMGYSVTLTGLGSIVMPQVISFFLDFYGVQGTMIILAALSLHCLVGALLLQPVGWHSKKEIISSVEEFIMVDRGEDQKEKIQCTDDQQHSSSRIYKEDSINDEVNTASIYEIESIDLNRSNSITFSEQSGSRQESKKSKHNFVDNSNQDGPVFLGNTHEAKDQLQNSEKTLNNESLNGNCCCSVLHKIYYFFDLDLFTDLKYANLLLGISIAVFSEMNFSLLTPFILNDFELTTIQIATVMSVIGFADVVFRFMAPFVGEFFNFSPKMMCMFSFGLLIISRSCILFFNSYFHMIVIGIFLGIAKGIRTVYISLVIPAYVPLDRLAAASGLQMMVIGILMFFGPIIGVIRDYSQTYNNCIIFMNVITFTTIVMWTTEELWTWKQRKSKLKTENEKIIHNA